jgi:phage shock protein A
MGIFKRVGDIISANLNEMVEKYEDPIKMLRQAVGEMEDSIADSRRSVAKTMATEKLVARELANNERQLKQWQSRAEAAVEAGDDALARKALQRKREHEKILASLRDHHTAAFDSSQSMRRELEAMQAKLGEAKRRLGSLCARQRAADVRVRAKAASVQPNLNCDAFVKFDRLREKVEMAEAEAEAMQELVDNDYSTSTTNVATEIDIADVEVESELAKLKSDKRG